MRPPFFILSLGLLLFGMEVQVRAYQDSFTSPPQSVLTNAYILGPNPSTKVLIRMTVLGISEGVLYGSTLDNAGESIGFVSDTLATNDILYTIVNQNSAHPSFFATNGDFSSGTNIPKFPAVHSYFTEITGYSQGIVVGNHSVVIGGSKAFLIGTNGTFTTLTYPGAKPTTTVVTGIDQGTVVGHFRDAANGLHGFSYKMTNRAFNRIDVPSAIGRTRVQGVSEGVIYGSFVTPKGITKGFTESNSSFTTITEPDADNFTEVTGYSQGVIAGNYIDTNRVHHGFYFDGTNYTTADVGTTGYSRIAGCNQGETAGNFLATNEVICYSTSTNVAINRDIFLTTNYWHTTLAQYPPHPTSFQVIRYNPPKSNTTNSSDGSTSLGSSNSYSGGTLITSGTLALGGAWSNADSSDLSSFWNFSNSGTNYTFQITNGGSVTNSFSGSTNTNGVSGGTFGGSIIDGLGSITQIGSGTSTLSGSNSYSGGVTISGGTIILGNAGWQGSSTNSITFTGGTLNLNGFQIGNPINGLVFSSGTNTGSLTISNFGSSDYILGNFGSSNSLIISPGASDTISFGDYTGTNSDIALTLTKNGVTNPTGGAFLILPGTNKVEFLLP